MNYIFHPSKSETFENEAEYNINIYKIYSFYIVSSHISSITM